MKKTIYYTSIILIVLFISIENNYAQEIQNSRDSSKVLNEAIDTTTYRFVEKMPEFPGGFNEFNKYLVSELKYPENCRMMGITGVVIVEFIVEEDGRISNVKALTKVYPDLDAEAVRVIQNMPRWEPSEIRGTPQRTFYQLPIRFSLE